VVPGYPWVKLDAVRWANVIRIIRIISTEYHAREAFSNDDLHKLTVLIEEEKLEN